MKTPPETDRIEHGTGPGERSLAEALVRDGPMPARRVARIAAQVLEALAATHGRGGVQCELTPAAIVLRPAGGEPEVATVIDAGPAAEIDVAALGLAAPRAKSVTGAPGYIAPERLRGEPATPRSDLYALGLVMAEMLTGAAVVRGPDLASTCTIHLSDDPLPLPGEVLGSPLGEVIRRAVEKDPEWRFSSAGEMRAVIERTPFEPGDDAWRAGWANAAPSPERDAGPVEAPAPPKGGRLGQLLTVTAVVLAVVAVLVATLLIGRAALRPDPAPAGTAAFVQPAEPPVPDAPEVEGLAGTTGDQLRAAIVGAGWEVANDSTYQMPGIEARTFVVRRGQDQARVFWNEHQNRGVAQRLERGMRDDPTTVTAREGGTLVWVFHPREISVSRELLAAILSRVGAGAAGGDAGPDAGR